MFGRYSADSAEMLWAPRARVECGVKIHSEGGLAESLARISAQLIRRNPSGWEHVPAADRGLLSWGT
jgi:hypothetical protein